MNAMQSLMDAKMVYLDVVAGTTGVFMFTSLNVSPKYEHKLFILAPLMLIARLVTDAIYYYCVSKSDVFGGTILELAVSSFVWMIMVVIMSKILRLEFTFRDIAFLYISTVIMMLATAKVTGWG